MCETSNRPQAVARLRMLGRGGPPGTGPASRSRRRARGGRPAHDADRKAVWRFEAGKFQSRVSVEVACERDRSPLSRRWNCTVHDPSVRRPERSPGHTQEPAYFIKWGTRRDRARSFPETHPPAGPFTTKFPGADLLLRRHPTRIGSSQVSSGLRDQPRAGPSSGVHTKAEAPARSREKPKEPISVIILLEIE